MPVLPAPVVRSHVRVTRDELADAVDAVLEVLVVDGAEVCAVPHLHFVAGGVEGAADDVL